tara:strand:- start:1760 stop:3580 length:1821 start_codon:yes stop_codon:yes gene_type:complete
MKRLAVIITFYFSLFLVHAQEFVAKVSTPKIGINQSFNLSFELNGTGSSFKAPDLKNFQIVSGPNQSSSMSMVNGSISQSLTYSYTLRPRKLGKLKIGKAKIHCNGRPLMSNELTIQVQKEDVAAAKKSNQRKSRNPFSSDPFFNQNRNQQQSQQVDLSKEIHLVLNVTRRKMYLGEQFLATYKIYFNHNIQIEDFSLSPKFKGFWSQDIKVPENNVKRENYKGETYNAALIKKVLLTPQKSGDLEVDALGLKLNAQIQQRGGWGFFNNYRNVKHNVESNSARIKVNPLPKEGQPANFKGAVGQFTLKSNLSTEQAKTNSSVSLTVKLNGSGNLPLVEVPELEVPQDIEAYDPKTKESIKISGSRNIGTKSYEYLLIPRYAGKYKIEPLEFVYFDPKKKAYKTLKTPTYTLDVEGEEKQSTNNTTYAYSSKDEVNLLGKDILYIKSDGVPELAQEAYYGSWLFHLLWVGSIALLIAAIIWVQHLQNMLSNVALLRRKKAGSVALKHLKEAKAYMESNDTSAFYNSLSAGLSGYVKDKMGLKQSELSTEQIEKTIKEQTSNESISEGFLSLVEACQIARFSPNLDVSSMQKDYLKGVELINQMEKEI